MNFDGIYNHYERLVYDEVMRILAQDDIKYSIDDAEDIACIALNHLPSRYVRHSVDTVFFLAESDKLKMDNQVTEAVSAAFERVKSHPGVPD